MDFYKQYQHPNWQRLRLTMFEAAGWECEYCGSTETSLHVHHKHYVKGRKVWEYESHELEVLCEQCHANQHLARDKLKAITDSMSPDMLDMMIGFAKAVMLDFGEVESIRIDSAEEADGVFSALRRRLNVATVEELYGATLTANGDRIDVQAKQFSPSSPG